MNGLVRTKNNDITIYVINLSLCEDGKMIHNQNLKVGYKLHQLKRLPYVEYLYIYN